MTLLYCQLFKAVKNEYSEFETSNFGFGNYKRYFAKQYGLGHTCNITRKWHG